MIERGKFRSLTLINWNGFFARTFDLDELVTTLSGGNGAGKSTTMAAFVTALIPDLTLLHFRNTTEAGATAGAKDKGLYGKLKPGICYAILDVINSRQQRIVVGVRLQQIAGRDRKVDIKAFALEPNSLELPITTIFTETITQKQARVLTLIELKEQIEQQELGQFKQFNSITDYHSTLFDLGVIPKRLRSSADRSKFYRLIEASLYGGISSTITRSLRDYLLPENSGVKQAFQDMELALRENRMTLEAIKVTQADRDLFKHLIAESTLYVAADYMRHLNGRKLQIEQALFARQELLKSRVNLLKEQQRSISLTEELVEKTAEEENLQADYQAINDHLSLLQTAFRQQEKITRYQDELQELQEKLEQQQEIAFTAEQQQERYQHEMQVAEQEVDGLKNQLANYQQALDVQQTRALQYQHAIQALTRAQELCSYSQLSLENIDEFASKLTQQEQQATQKLLSLEQAVNVIKASQDQFENAYQLVCRVAGSIKRTEAGAIANKLLKNLSTYRHQAERLSTLRYQRNELEQKLELQQESQHLLQTFCQLTGKKYQLSELHQTQELLEQQLATLLEQKAMQYEQKIVLQQKIDASKYEEKELIAKAPQYILAQEALFKLREQCGGGLESHQQIMQQMQWLLERERQLTTERDKLAVQITQIEAQIERLSQPSGAEDGRLIGLAEQFGGVLLPEIYEDVTLEDAPYFSALYGPARHAIVLPSLANIREQLLSLEDCPEDLYLIEGDPQAFDDSVFIVEEVQGAVIVKASEHQWRYSRFPTTPMFGRAARENYLVELRKQRDTLTEQYAVISFDLQKNQRLHQTLGQFIGQYLATAFENDPEKQMAELRQCKQQFTSDLDKQSEQLQQITTQEQQIKAQLSVLNQLLPYLSILADEDIMDKVEEIRAQYTIAEEAQYYLQQHEKVLIELEPLVVLLQHDPQHSEQLQQDYQHAKQQQELVQKQRFTVMDIIQRKPHFNYSDSVAVTTDKTHLSESLRKQLVLAEQTKEQAKQFYKQYQHNYIDVNQLVAALKSAFDTKHQVLYELSQELKEIGVKADQQAQERTRIQRDALQAALQQNRDLCNQLSKQLTFCEAESESLNKKLHHLTHDYHLKRKQVVSAKVSWCTVLGMVKHHHIEHRLHKRDFAYLHADELRSMSDKALGALRQAVADNEYLRDILRASEDPKYPDQKVAFYLAMYAHLRERIRQDIIQTNDPIDAIEQMEIELARLTEELTHREKKLAISSRAVANIIRKTIQREQNRIRMLNQGLQAVAFGQVKSVRLDVSIRETHVILLNALNEQQEQHQDLFNSQRLTFSEALAKLYQRLHPQIDIGQKTAQVVGEELLDYRNYLELSVEVFRGADGWLKAESGALSTGEAIGTGMSILVMVVQSWEEEARRLRSKEIIPCRLLFLDEAARLDAKSIATLFELCERLQMQLVIAAPENISPEKGTTYKLVRKVFQNTEHVHVVGLRGFSTDNDPKLSDVLAL